MIDKKPEALRLADVPLIQRDMAWHIQTNALLRTQHAELQKWKDVFGHLGTADECGNEWIRLQDAIERKDALLRKCLKHVASNISMTSDGTEAEELYDAIKEELQ